MSPKQRVGGEEVEDIGQVRPRTNHAVKTDVPAIVRRILVIQVSQALQGPIERSCAGRSDTVKVVYVLGSIQADE